MHKNIKEKLKKFFKGLNYFDTNKWTKTSGQNCRFFNLKKIF